MNEVKVVCLHHDDFINFPRAQKQIATLDDQEGVSVTAIAPSFADTNSNKPKIGGAEIKYYERPIAVPNIHVLKIINVLLAMFVLAYASWREEGDIYHCVGVYSLIVGVLNTVFRTERKLTYDAPEDYGCQIKIAYPSYIGTILSRLLQSLEQLLVRFAHTVFTINSSDKLPYNRFVAVNDNTHILENVPWLSEFDSPDSLSNPYEDYGDRTILIYVGGLSKMRGGDMLLNVIEIVIKKHSDVLLVIIGDGSDRYMAHLRNRIERDGLEDNVLLLGAIEYDEVRRYLSNANIGVQFYQHGPWNSRSMASSTIFRHMGFGLPLVVTDLPGMGTQISEYECGFAPSVTDEKAISMEICRLIENKSLALELGQKGRQLIKKEYNWEAESEAFLKNMPLDLREPKT